MPNPVQPVDNSPAKNTRSSTKPVAETQHTHNSEEESSHSSHKEEQKQLPRKVLAKLKRKLHDNDKEDREEDEEDDSDLDDDVMLQQMKDGINKWRTVKLRHRKEKEGRPLR